jgi:hypothetical protein
VDPKLELVRLSKLVDAIVADLLDDSSDEPKQLYLTVESSLARLAQEMDYMVLLSEKHANEIEALCNSNEMLIGLLSGAWDRLGSTETQLVSAKNIIQQDIDLQREIERIALESSHYKQELDQRNTQILALYSSTSWKISAPIRLAKLSVTFFERSIKGIVTVTVVNPIKKGLRVFKNTAPSPSVVKKGNEDHPLCPQEILRILEDLKSELRV